MATDLIIDRGRGPELAGTRTTVYNLLPYFLDETVTEEYICQACELTADQVAAARAYALNHADEVMAEHRGIEARFAAGNPPEVIETAKRAHAAFERFREDVSMRKRERAGLASAPKKGDPLPTFQEWLRERNGHPKET